MRPLLLAYPGNEALGESVSRALDADTVPFAMRRFPDGETYLRIDSEVRDRTVAILCSLHEPDEKLLPLVFLSDTLRELGARAVGLIAPYLAYMRQDRRFEGGEAVTSASFARLLSKQFDWLITVDPHLHRRRALGEIYSIPTEVVHAAPHLAEWIRVNVAAPLVAGPDSESDQWVRAVAEAVPCPSVVLEKMRRGDRDVTVSPIPTSHVRTDRTPVLIDDIISSARTMIEAVRQWRAAGATAPVCVGVHAVFAGGAFTDLVRAGAARVVTCNTIPHESNAIDLSPLIAIAARDFLTGSPTLHREERR
jgi:ribose-phosphate pyrophosphokinase